MDRRSIRRPRAFVRRDGPNTVAKGKKLVETIGCKGCHGFADGEFTTPLGKSQGPGSES